MRSRSWMCALGCVLASVAARSAAADDVYRRPDWGVQLEIPADATVLLGKMEIEIVSAEHGRVRIWAQTKAEAAEVLAHWRTLPGRVEDLGVAPDHWHRYRHTDEILLDDGAHFLRVFTDPSDATPGTTAFVPQFQPITPAPARVPQTFQHIAGAADMMYANANAVYSLSPGSGVQMRSLDGAVSWAEFPGDAGQIAGGPLTRVVGTEAVTVFDMPYQGTTAIARTSPAGTKTVFTDPHPRAGYLDGHSQVGYLASDGIARVGYLTDDLQLTASTDGGATWHTVALPTNVTAKQKLVALGAADGAWFLATDIATYRSLDGAQWSAVGKQSLHGVVAAGKQLVALAADAIWTSADHGVTWTSAATAIGVYTLHAAGAHVYALVAASGNSAMVRELVGTKLVATFAGDLACSQIVATAGVLLVEDQHAHLYRLVPATP